MRVAYICADAGVPVFGRKGSSIHVQEVVRALRAHGAEVELFAARTDGEPPSDLADLRVHSLPAPSKGDIAERERAAYAANEELRQALRRAGSFDFIYERYSLWSYAGMEHARAFGTPGLLEVNAPLIEEQRKHRGLADEQQAERVAKIVFGSATTLIAVSEGVAAYLRRFPSVNGRAHVIPNGVNPARFPLGLKPALPASPASFTVGFVGTLKPWHGLADLVEAFALLHEKDGNARLLIVGDGPERESLEADLAARSLLDATVLTGAVSHELIPGLLASMDVAVAPYPDDPDFYFSPLKVYEYMAAALPVAASRIGQLEELIEHEHNGLLFPPGDVRALAEALDRLRRDRKFASRLGSLACMKVLRSHTWESVARRIIALAGVEVAMAHGEVSG
ncbi:MAG: glycosyltransferase family 4 protein [Pyrinomonadaceae bacterium]